MNPEEKCPCGKDLAYKDCCGKIHQNRSNAKTAEDLMRSRYTAFVLGLGDYLMESHHESTRGRVTKEALVNWAKPLEWVKLEIVRTKNGQENDEDGIVEFKAHYKEGRYNRVLHQRSNFVREYGVWSYVDEVGKKKR